MSILHSFANVSTLPYIMKLLSYTGHFETIYNDYKFQWGIAIILSLLLAFEHQIDLFVHPVTSYTLLAITLALTITEYKSNPGFIILMVSLTVIAFNLSLSKQNVEKI